MGVETTYYVPTMGVGISDLFRPNTKLVYCETPGSQTMEVQDIPALADVAHRHGLLVLVDNSWSGGHYFKAFEHGADIVVQSASKYIGGHSDLLMGTIATNEAAWPALPAYDERFRRMWRYYLLSSAAGFRARDVQLWQLVFRRRGPAPRYHAAR